MFGRYKEQVEAIAFTVFATVITAILVSTCSAAWWNSTYPYRSDIVNETTLNIEAAINGTYGINGNVTWVNSGNYSNLWMYYSTTAYRIANESIEANSDSEQGVYDYNPTSVYRSDAYGIWHLQDTEDSAVGNRDLAAVNTPVATTTKCFYDGCYDFEEADNDGFSATIGNIDAWTELTIMGWFCMESADDTDGTLFFTSEDAGNGNFGCNLDETGDDDIKCNVGDGTGANAVYTGIVVAAGDCGMIAMTAKEGDYVRAYYNGTEVGTPNAISAFGNIGTSLVIGKWATANGQSWDGTIDEVRLYNSVLTAGQIQFLYNNSINKNMQLSGSEMYVASWVNVSTVNASQPVTILANATAGTIDSCYAEITYPNGTAANYTMDYIQDYNYSYHSPPDSTWYSGTWTDSSNINDTDWGTYGTAGSGANAYWNFTIPDNVVDTWNNNQTFFQYKIGGSAINTSRNLLGRCIVTAIGEDKNLEMRAESTNKYFVCYDGLTWSYVGASYTDTIYEIAMWWAYNDTTQYGVDFNNTYQIGTYSVTVHCNNTAGTNGTATTAFNVTPAFTVNGVSPTTDQLEGANVTYFLNLTAASYVSDINVTAWMNLTTYSVTKANNGTNYYFTASIVMPSVSTASILYNNFWNTTTFFSTGTSNYTFTHGNTTVYDLILTNCSNGELGETLRFYLLDELTKGTLTGNLSAVFTVWKNGITTVYPFVLLNAKNFSFCLTPVWGNYSLNATLVYSSVGYTTRSSYIKNLVSSGTTLNLYNLTLLNSSLSSTLTVYVQNSGSIRLTGVQNRMEKYEPTTGTYTPITTSVTDDEGKSIFDVYYGSTYRFNLTYGNISYQTGDYVIISTPLTITIPSTTGGYFWLYYWSVNGSCTGSGGGFAYNLSCTTSDASGAMTEACIEVRDAGTLIINCSSCAAANPSCYLEDITGVNLTWQLIGVFPEIEFILDTGDILSGGGAVLGDTGIYITGILVVLGMIIGSNISAPAAIILAYLGFLFSNLLKFFIVDSAALLGITVVCLLVAWRVSE